MDSKAKSSGFAQVARAEFLKRTAHLGPEAQLRVLEAMRAAHRSKLAREKANQGKGK